MGIRAAVAIAVVFMVLYVIFGGTKGTGMVGIVKMALLYVTVIACGGTLITCNNPDEILAFLRKRGKHK